MLSIFYHIAHACTQRTIHNIFRCCVYGILWSRDITAALNKVSEGSKTMSVGNLFHCTAANGKMNTLLKCEFAVMRGGACDVSSLWAAGNMAVEVCQ